MALWTPAQITTALWLDAADSSTMTLDESLVSQWRDKSGNTRHASQTGSARPTRQNTVNDLDVVTFANGLWMDGNHGTQDWREVYVAGVWTGNNTTFPGFNGVFTGRGAGGGDLGLIGDTNANWYPGWYDTLRLNTAATTVAFNTIKSPFLVEFSKGSAVSANGYRLGTDRTNQDREWHGHFFEVLAFNSIQGLEIRQKIQGYLAHKWGFSSVLPSDHPYKSAAPTVISISGTIYDRNGDPCKRKVYAVTRPTDTTAPVILAHGLSDAVTGEYELVLSTEAEVTRVVVSEDDEDPLLNDLVDRIILE